ncbi:MAG: DNRLRE domain-containing protein, partial [Desulfobacterales bacterium]|nr:DNRLRE domain-containing protein [Desulfobacterales bacterium]
IVEISKKGYRVYTDTLTLTEIAAFSCIDGAPYKVILEKITELVLQPGPAEGKDAFIEEYPEANYSNRNFGNYPEILASAWTADGIPLKIRSLIEFDLAEIPEGTKIKSAKLSLYHAISSGHGLGHSSQSGSNEWLLQRVTSDWSEDKVTWNTRPSFTDQNEVLVSESTDPYQDYVDIDVTSLIQDIIDNPTASFGIQLKLATESYYRKVIFSSSDCSDSTLWPKLVVEI